MIKIRLIILSLISLFSCKISKLNIEGSYVKKMDLKLSESVITINNNHTFIYSYTAGDLYKFAVSGTWRFSKSKDSIFLTSEFKNDTDLISVTELKSDSLISEKVIEVLDTSDQPLAYYVIINPNHQKNIDFKSSDYVLGTKKLGNILINEIALTSTSSRKIIFYKTMYPSYNLFIIHIKLAFLDRYKYFNEESFRIEKNKIINGEIKYIKKNINKN